MRLASRFSNPVSFRSSRPLLDDEIMKVAPSIFANDAHSSRSDRYTYIPTIEVLNELRKEGFQPFMVAQTRVRNEDKVAHTKHMIRLRHANQINGTEANEIILLNSHDGTSSYQMLAGAFRFVCENGMVCGRGVGEIRVRHQGNIVGDVIDGAYAVLENFEVIDEQCEAMKMVTLNTEEQAVFARAALTLKYDDEMNKAPIRDGLVLRSRRSEDNKNDLWTTFNRVQENIIKGGLPGYTQTGRRLRTRAVTGIDQDVKLNKALWVLADEMRRLKA